MSFSLPFEKFNTEFGVTHGVECGDFSYILDITAMDPYDLEIVQQYFIDTEESKIDATFDKSLIPTGLTMAFKFKGYLLNHDSVENFVTFDLKVY